MALHLVRHAVVGGFLLCAACVCSRDGGKDAPVGPSDDDEIAAAAKGFVLAPDVALADLTRFTSAAHPFGSTKQAEIVAWLTTRIQEAGVVAVHDPFTAETPNPAVTADSGGPMALTVPLSGANLIASGTLRDEGGCVVALATHVDTKVVPGVDYLGANDGGSSTVVLLQQLAYLKRERAKLTSVSCDVIGIFFDGEEAVLPNWTDGLEKHPAAIQDNTYGSRSLASRLTACAYEGKPAKCLPAALGGKPLVALILMDMIGSPGLVVSRERFSSAKLVDIAAAGAKKLGKPGLYANDPHGIEDDHVPFLKAGVAAIDLIDFEHLQYWHRAGDEASHISTESLGLAGQLALFTALSAASQPKVFASGTE